MKTRKPRCWTIGRAAALAAALVSVAVAGYAQSSRPAFKDGEIILYCQPGTSQSDVQALAQKVQAVSTEALLLKDCYHLILPAVDQTDGATLAAVATLKGDSRVRWVGPNRYKYTTQATRTVPNDPLYSKLWGFELINMPLAWTIEKGEPGSNVCVIDSGFDEKHEDLVNSYLPLSYDASTGTNDPTPDGTGGALQHGVHVSGTIVAGTNNGIGVSGICWDNIKCLGIKVHKKGDPDDSLNGAALINGYAYLQSHIADQHIVALNMSYGSDSGPPNPADPEYVALQAIHDAGVICVAAAGNSGSDNSNFSPCNFPFVVSVSALGPQGELSFYSSFGKVELAAPGGDDPAFITDNAAAQILSTRDGGYHTEQGTSMASPHACGVLTLVRSIPGVTRDIAVQAVESTANRANITGGVPDADFGYGRVDAYQAVLKVSVSAIIQSPVGVNQFGQTSDPTGLEPPVETFKPNIQIQIGLAPLANVTVTIDGKQIPNSQLANDVISGNPTGPAPRYTLEFPQAFPVVAGTVHEVDVSATNPGTGVTRTDQRFFSISPHVFEPEINPAGVSMISLPYLETSADSPTGLTRQAGDMFGHDITMYRYNPVGAPPYIIYTDAQPSSQFVRPLAEAFAGADTAPPAPVGGATDTRPVGLGYFLRSSAAVPVITFGRAQAGAPYAIPLHEGWNLIGDPYPFAVSFNACQLQTNGGSAMTMSEAVTNHMILPFLYRFVQGQYQFTTLPDGALAPWEGHWVFVTPANPTALKSGTVLTLIVPVAPTQPPAGGGRAASLPRASGAGSWTVRLGAHSGALADTNNFIGESTGAATRADTRVPKPPKAAAGIALAIVRPDTPTMQYAQDIRPLGSAQTWNVTVDTSGLKQPVVLNWDGLAGVPKSTSLVLTDLATGVTVNLRNMQNYTFTPTGDTRNFALTTRQELTSGRPLISNVVVNSPRSASGRATGAYTVSWNLSQDATVDVQVLSGAGRTLARLSTGRAASAGAGSAVWNGRDDQNRTLPAGAYILQIRAVTGTGAVTRITRPLVVTGR